MRVDGVGELLVALNGLAPGRCDLEPHRGQLIQSN